jgi:hypothetical protein
MDDADKLISFHVVPGPKGIAEAEQRLRSAGFEQIQRSHGGRRLQVVAPQDVVERVLGFSLMEKQRRSRVGVAEREVVDLRLPEGAALPPILQDVVAEIIFPVIPDYYQSAVQRRKSL